jgi:hypothetical protein
VVLLIAILTLVLAGLVVLVVGAPVRRARRVRDAGSGAGSGAGALSNPGDATGDAHASQPAYARDELEAAREAKYREIRDAELDYRTGKLSRVDYEAIDADLRAEAIEILNRLERLRPKGP